MLMDRMVLGAGPLVSGMEPTIPNTEPKQVQIFVSPSRCTMGGQLGLLVQPRQAPGPIIFYRDNDSLIPGTLLLHCRQRLGSPRLTNGVDGGGLC